MQNNNTNKKMSDLIKKLDEQSKLITNLENQLSLMSAEMFEYKLSKTYKLRELKHQVLSWLKGEFKQSKYKYKVFKQFRKRTKYPLISIVIPVYDRTHELRKSIDSILKQKYPNLEVIIVTDGSPPETIGVLNEYQENPKVKIFYYFQQSGNAVRGRNKGIKESQGEYIAFQDSDDIADPYRLIKSLDYLQLYNVDVVYGGWKAWVDKSRKDISVTNGRIFFSPDCTIDIMKEKCIPCQSTVMAKKSALMAVGGLNTQLKYHEDHELWLRLMHSGYKLKAIPEVLSTLKLHSGNNELNFKKEDIKWHQAALENYTKKIKLPLKVAYLIPGTGIGGGIAVICEHLNRLPKEGFDPLIITEGSNTDLGWFPKQSVNIVTLKDTDQLENIDILVLTGWSTAYSGQHIKAKRKVYFVQSDERRFFPDDLNFVKQVHQTYQMEYEYMTEALWIKKWLKKEFGKEASLIPNGINTEIFHETKPLAPKPKNKLRVLLEGPIDIPFKGMTEAFEVVKDLDCEVWCISSSGKPKPGWKCDRFFEKVPMAKMKNIYSSCDILLKMSKVEGFFGPPLEMMACGGVPIVAKVTGYDEYIKDGYNALVIKSGDIQGARQAIKKLATNKILYKKLQSNGQQTVKNWSWDRSLTLLKNILEKNN